MKRAICRNRILAYGYTTPLRLNSLARAAAPLLPAAAAHTEPPPEAGGSLIHSDGLPGGGPTAEPPASPITEKAA